MKNEFPDEITVGPDGTVISRYSYPDDQRERMVSPDVLLTAFGVGTVAQPDDSGWAVLIDADLRPFSCGLDCDHEHGLDNFKVFVPAVFAELLADSLRKAVEIIETMPPPSLMPRPEGT